MGRGSLGRLLAPLFREVQHRVASLIRDKIIVGHNLWLFLSVSGVDVILRSKSD